jgi:RNA polymerase sigma factor (sigma-70 family)
VNAAVSRQRRDDGEAVALRTAGVAQAGGELDEAVAAFVRARPRLMAIAYRFLASTSDAEDVVQETWLRWQKADRTVVTDPQALLATMATRLAINVSHCARRRREMCTALPALDCAQGGEDPATSAELRESLEQAVLIVMESLSPKERAAFVLREAFGYPYGRISELIHLRPANSRQLVSRARKHVAAHAHTVAPSTSHQTFLQAFLNAARSGDLPDFEEVLTADLDCCSELGS